MTNSDFADKEVRRRIKKRVDFLDPSGDATYTCGHGTRCVGLSSRVAPAADIYVGRVAQDFESGLDEQVVAKAIRTQPLVPKAPTRVTGMLTSIPSPSASISSARPWQQLSGRLCAREKLLLTAASNSGTRRGMAFPASKTGVIAINAATGDGKPSAVQPASAPGEKS
ncbi:hypothetical protein B0T25DRAFT_7881 [Lasiosphaeria hispida]|uniref:Peptidase S8/S53 domain-containing protein n=1 Tax=Lasiosphaeria hispida TaxID=260671 RepID=A0AAJ0HTC6_9PEZI|nr:hypothetical protein B0T25DRAFT_7881 [Lasiosphaeria hispida]